MKLNRTVQRTIEILSYISGHPQGVSLDELCSTFSLPKTSAYDILVTLVHTNMLSVRSGNPQLYQTGMEAYRIGMSYPDADDELKIIQTALSELAKHFNRTTFFGKRSGNEVLYILKEMPENPIITTANVGSTAPLYCTSLGKVLLSYLPEEQTSPIIDSLQFQPRTQLTIQSKEKLRKELAITKQRGYALDFREFEEHMVCASAPVYRRDSSLAGAISISGFYSPEEDYSKTGELIREKAAELSHLLGYRSHA